MEWERKETALFQLYANPPGQHGRLIATADSDGVVKQCLFNLYGVPIESWTARHYSEDGSRVLVWMSQYANAQTQQAEPPGTYFTAERVLVLQGNRNT